MDPKASPPLGKNLLILKGGKLKSRSPPTELQSSQLAVGPEQSKNAKFKINFGKIRKSPSPPQNLKGEIVISNENESSRKDGKKPFLAQDFIKQMITSNNNTGMLSKQANENG